ncbi:MAG TPA: PilZ domain-containing protein [Spirochaetia bacterium]|nr:PilZ domain-containing protein [Spirochaetia bacterium]
MEDRSGSERRRLKRFSLKAFAVVQSTGAERVFELSTQDISAGGAFFPMEVPLPTGEKVKITLYLSISPVEPVIDFPGKAKITTEGQVVRSTTQGMAVAFGRHYTISPVAM